MTKNEDDKKILMTLCMICRQDKMLLGLKKRGFGVGKLVGFGGKVHKDESVQQSVVREVFEEAGIHIKNPKEMGVLYFSWKNKTEGLKIHVFLASDFEGVPIESDEMAPEWFEISALPYEKMWEDDIYWLPIFLEGKKFKGKFLLGDNNEILSHQLFL